MPTIQELAKEALTFFTTDTRQDGTEYVRTTCDRPDWLRELIFAAHNNGEMLPDDWRYGFICEALSYISEHEEDIDIEVPDEMEASIYTHELTGWLHSRTDRYEYVDEAREVYGDDSNHSITTLISWGQLAEKHEVYYSVLDSLKQHAEEMENNNAD